ncbi:tetratricopeptide repeat protein [Aureitalea sp. L0-47]|uniref:tetratricopeptide repeat protein n=1 Tax=Aureitalea sp. L0-47 TaxID=2816962 RepID=UPI002237ABC1|nr:tetratricopeptide repeat protein [Aureitalea sp. L0-47]MCW5520149.1 tetratricopeptide repeat protein [Aureitalea sp. L0-47]
MKKLLLLLLFPSLIWAQSSFDQAVEYFSNEQFSKAKPLFQKYLKENPGHDKTREYLGDIAGTAKDWDAAISYYESLVEENPDNPDYNFKYGGVLGMKAQESNKLKALGYIGDIKEHLNRAATLDPNHIEVRWALVELYMQLPGIIGGSEKKAMKYADELKIISPVDGYLAHGYIAEYNERPADAEKYYKKAIEIGGSPHTYEKLTNLYEKNNQPREAMANAAVSLKKHKRNSLNYQIGKISAQYNLSPETGIKCLVEYIQNYSVRDGVPKDWAYFRLAQIYKNTGDKDRALKWINKALKDRPDFKEARQEKQHILSL